MFEFVCPNVLATLSVFYVHFTGVQVIFIPDRLLLIFRKIQYSISLNFFINILQFFIIWYLTLFIIINIFVP